MKILTFGSSNIDYVYSVPHFVKPGETLSSSGMNYFPGGKGLNQSIAIARSGAQVYHAGCIGTDGLFLKELLEEAGANTEYLKIVDAASGHAIIQVDDKGENSIILFGGANYLIDECYIDEVLKHFGAGDILVLQNEISNIDYIINQAYTKKMQIVLNPSPFHDNLRQIDLNKIYILMLNEIEANEFCTQSEPAKVCEYFRSQFENLKVVLTLGAKGSIYFDKDTEQFCPSFSVKIEDTTSAGDTYTGYFISALKRGLPIAKALKTASVAAALAVSRKGAAASIPYANEVEDALKTLKANINEDSEVEKKKGTCTKIHRK